MTAEEDESYTKSTLGDHRDTTIEEQKAAASVDPTKRNIVGVSSRFYDPLGLISPCIVLFKLLAQRLWETGSDWDTPLSGELLAEWNHLVKCLTSAPCITIPRHCLRNVCDIISCSLHGHCDASSRAYAAVVYLKVLSSTGVCFSLLASKTKVAPSKKHTIPRLELLSALLLARLMTRVSQAIEHDVTLGDPLCHTDSKIALYWITSQREWKLYVQNRVSEICKLVPAKFWRHCSGISNPADIPSRGMTLADLSKEMRWWHGPGSSPLQYESDDFDDLPVECFDELKKSSTLLVQDTPGTATHPFVDCENYSSLNRLLRVTAYVFRFIKLLKGGNSSVLELTASDIGESRLYWLQKSQESLGKFSSWCSQFGLFKDESNLWKCGGRLQNAQSAKHPILLNPKHHLTLLIVRDCHQATKHGGVKETLAHLRSSYWIVRGRNYIKKLIHRCAVCRRFDGRQLPSPNTPPLPEFRVNEVAPFTCTGIDFAGPLYLRTSEKVWICLFTCAVVRAVHLEIITDMTAQSFLRCFVRFVSRRGLPSLIVSDNVKTYKSAKGILNATLSSATVQQFLANKQVTWNFNLERAPWWGGFFERLIGLMKRCLKKSIGQSKLSYDELSTLVVEVEGILNSRPLTYVSSDDIDEPLTPSHLVIGRRLNSLPKFGPDIQNDEYIPNPSIPDLTRRLVHLNNLIDQFWERWRREYLLELREPHRYANNTQEPHHLKVGDIVIIYDPDSPRSFWRIAWVESLIPSHDGLIRGAVVKTHSKNGSVSYLRRPVQHLYLLEMGESEIDHPNTDKDTDGIPTQSAQPIASGHHRPTRKAAQIAKEGIQLMFSEHNV